MGVNIHNVDDTSFDVNYEGLEHDWSTTSGYDYAKFVCNNGDVEYDFPPSSSSSNDTGDVTFSGLDEGEFYYVDVYISFDGVEYEKGSDYTTTLPEEPVNVHLEDNTDNIYVD
ncbi:MAG: hypothetical protein K9L56_14080 [Clostridiales bacterium]|nr:hypothetical protein [Clostridiales bacterium]